MATPPSAFVWSLLGIVIGALLTFALQRYARRHDRREEWYVDIEAELHTTIQRLDRVVPQLEASAAEVQRLLVRLQILEAKLGPFFRVAEDYLTEGLKPHPPYRSGP